MAFGSVSSGGRNTVGEHKRKDTDSFAQSTHIYGVPSKCQTLLQALGI